MTCPACNSDEIPNQFPTAGQGPITDKFVCGSEYYAGELIYPCGHKSFDLPKIDSNDPTTKRIIETLRKLR